MSPLRWSLMGLAGCVVGVPEPPLDGGQSGSEQPPMCVVDSRIEVADPTVPADGFDFAAQDAVDALTGTWSGQGTLEGGGPATVALAVASGSGPITAVLSHYEDPNPGCESCSGPTALGAPESEGGPAFACPPVYEIPLDLSLHADPYLSADARTVIDVSAPDRAEMHVELDRALVGGTLEPPAWEPDAYWDREALTIDFSVYDAASNQLSLTWLAINDDAENQQIDTGAGSGTVVTVEPAGMTSPIVTLLGLTRAP